MGCIIYFIITRLKEKGKGKAEIFGGIRCRYPLNNGADCARIQDK